MYIKYRDKILNIGIPNHKSPQGVSKEKKKIKACMKHIIIRN